ncbi:3-deoxy-D-manno-octulosonic acid transferase [Thalassovita taeanensis]|uniref:3-deoxy-D-manno-octulosonic acid transferase n=1 Tax=Thalassovita taeanensis TaxID=657014 RepID=A0A1H9CFL2_9RHOB|nr:glycosyltransferase N-terminal domain-containing protein [Thalassovita taeanensis]SEQ00006.1 3-deoxy-D-manno-octulosonic-acid transferase [Thalassovita taeanensis]
MPRNLSLKTYMALARRAPREKAGFLRPRPTGDLLWGHATSLPKAAALLQLTQRLTAQRPGLHLLLTTPPDLPRPDQLKSNVIWQSIPAESILDIKDFLSHWRPDICLWTGGYLRPALIASAAQTGMPMYLVDAEEPGLDDARFRWLPDLTGGTLRLFRGVMASSANAAQRLLKLGASEDLISITGPLQEGPAALPCDESQRDALALGLAGRPVWLAAMAQPEEVETIAQAHRASMRFAHRQLLILVPDDESGGAEIADTLRSDGWCIAEWSKREYPEEATQILLADTRGDLGLWYRLAPISFMASSLAPGHGGRDPYEPAALGSAILYGPNVSRYLSAYSRFANAGAARIVKDTQTLAAAIMRLSAPDQAASMANAAWEVSSDGAEVTDALIELVQDVLDLKEVS